MRKKTILTTITISVSLVDMACQFFNDNVSKSIIHGLSDFIMLPWNEQNLSSFSLHQLTTSQERNEKRSVSIRIPAELHAVIQGYSGDNNFSEKVELMLATVLYKPISEHDFKSAKLLRVIGNKFDDRMQNAISHIFSTANRNWDTSVETCAGGLGIHVNSNVAEKRIINDDDWCKFNLYRCLKENPAKVAAIALNMEVSRDFFNELKKKEIIPSKALNYEVAAETLYLNLLSHRNGGNTFLNDANIDMWHKRLSAIYPVHKQLANTEICEMDLFKILERYRKDQNVLFIVDPPYLDTNHYTGRTVCTEEAHGKKFDLKEHKKLAKLLRLAKENNGNDFIYFCRITATRRKNKFNQIVSTEKELRKNDNHMRGCIEDLYYGHGFYYKDVELDNGTIERIITSFPFEGACVF